jgi:hypothetical protein
MTMEQFVFAVTVYYAKLGALNKIDNFMTSFTS